MKVLFWTELFFPHIGGVEIFSAQLIKDLFKAKHKVKVITSHSGASLPDVSEKNGIKIHRFHFQKALAHRDIKKIKQISAKVIRLKKQFRPDLVHINTIQPSLFFFYHTRTFYPSPSLITLHQPPVSSSGNGSLLQSTLSTADWITAVSDNLLSRVKLYVPEIGFKSSVIYNGLESPDIEPSPLSFQPPTLLCVGRLIKDKGFDLVLTALRKVIRYFPDSRLIISGDGTQRKKLEEKALNLGLLDFVRFTGWIPPDEVPEIMNRASMVVVPSRWEEPFCLVALQAAQMERPVVAARTGGIPEIVQDKKTGLLFGKENVKDLTEKILFLIQNPNRAVDMGKTAKKRAETDFSIRRISRQYDSLYNRLNILNGTDRKA